MQPFTRACVACGRAPSRATQRGAFRYGQCPSCGTATLDPMPSDDEIEDHYRAKFVSGNYALLRAFADQYREVYKGFLSVLARALKGHGKGLQGAKIMEVGCFTGEFLSMAVDAGCDVVGFELQREAVEIASQKLPGRIHRVDVNDSALDGSVFDAVCLFGLVEHVKNPKPLIARCVSLLSPGGCILIQTPDNQSPPARIMGRYWPPYAPVEHLQIFSQRALTEILEGCGCRVIAVNAHWKWLPVEYVFEMTQHFGPELHRLIAPLYRHLPARVRRSSLPFYAGEMIMAAQRTQV